MTSIFLANVRWSETKVGSSGDSQCWPNSSVDAAGARVDAAGRSAKRRGRRGAQGAVDTSADAPVAKANQATPCPSSTMQKLKQPLQQKIA